MSGKNIFIVCTVMFLLGCALTGGATYYFIVRPSIERIGQYRVEQRRLEGINTELKGSVYIRQQTLDRASVIIRSTESSIQKIRAILLLLKQYEQDRINSGRSIGSDNNYRNNNFIQ